MLPFFFYAWAAAAMPASEPEPGRSIVDVGRPSPPTLLFGALAVLPVIGYGTRYLFPLGDPLDRDREIVTTVMLVSGLVMVMVRNVVERRALRYADRQVRLLAAACEQSDEPVVIARRGRIRYANDAFCRATGYSLGEVMALAPAQFAPPDASEAVSAALEQIRVARHIVRLTVPLIRKDGTVFDAACAIARIVDPDNQTVHLVCSVRDLGDERRLREQMVRAERMSAVGDLVSSVAHELNDPLQSILGTLDLLKTTQRDSELRLDIERASGEADRAATIVRNLVAFVRRTPGPRLLFDLGEIARAAVLLRAPALRSADIAVEEDYSPDLPVVLVNRDEIHQVIMSLIINAQQSMSANRRGRLTIRTRLSGTNAVLDVVDDGPGVPPDLAGRIFEPFVTTKEVSVGTGLGLSAAFGIATAHGGSLELVPTERGACFRLALPGSGFPGPAAVH